MSDVDLVSLVGDWVAVPDLAQRWGVPLSVVRRYLDERDLLGLRFGQPKVLRVPAAFATDEGPHHALRGTFTVLADAGYRDEEILEWLFTPDASLPGADTPMTALLLGHKTEVRRRAMEQAF